ncbi:MAG: acyl-CoA dehydrogenase [Bdellovibrionales bacterium]|nr:acyl-CoA dehydrogenase [Bdellovibrionales bacterium]MBT3526193.1 acyl-CoA dehydrogenase [Bdellovibrionales bacterium]MBT7767964.1 acyl-CoA dehydrogenase [Bdellovibrionales bacterium]
MVKAIDLYQLDSEWPAEYQTMIDQVRRFVNQEVLPTLAQSNEDATFPRAIIDGVRRLGILELHAAGELDPYAYGLVLRELERGSSGLRSFVSVQGSLVMSTIEMFGSEQQKSEWLNPLGTLDKIGCFGLTEPDFGSNPSGMLSTATKTESGYRLNGTKCWITNGTMADVAIIWAKLDGKVNAFLVETDRPGFQANPIKGKWSFRASDTAELVLEGVDIPESNRLPKATSLGYALKSLNKARYGIAWGVIGAAKAALEETINYLKNRPQFAGKPLTTHQLVQSKLAWMATEITSMDLIAKRLAELNCSGKLEPHHISLAKMNNCRKALEVTRTCRELLGANGIHDEYLVGRRMLDLETVITYEGTEHIHSLVIGEYLTGDRAYM